MTEVQKFKAALENLSFKVDNDYCYSYLKLIPSTYRDQSKNLIITGNIGIAIFGGVGTPEGQLGCVSMRLEGKTRLYRHRYVSEYGAIRTHAFVAKDAEHAIQEFHKWHEKIKNERKEWKEIL